MMEEMCYEGYLAKSMEVFGCAESRLTTQYPLMSHCLMELPSQEHSYLPNSHSLPEEGAAETAATRATMTAVNCILTCCLMNIMDDILKSIESVVKSVERLLVIWKSV